jgi:hypothetical protein
MRLTNSRQIYEHGDILDLNSMNGRFEFTRRLYKLATIFKRDDRSTFSDHAFVRGLAAYIKTDAFEGTIYSRKSTGKKRKADAPTPLEGGGEPSGSVAAVQGYELISDVIMSDKVVLEPLWKV